MEQFVFVDNSINRLSFAEKNCITANLHEAGVFAGLKYHHAHSQDKGEYTNLRIIAQR